MYNMIYANQQDIHWKKYSLFGVYQVEELIDIITRRGVQCSHNIETCKSPQIFTDAPIHSRTLNLLILPREYTKTSLYIYIYLYSYKKYTF